MKNHINFYRIIVCIVVCAFCYCCHEWIKYKCLSNELKERLNHLESQSDWLTPSDMFVFSECQQFPNVLDSMVYELDEVVIAREAKSISVRDNMLYWYIFAIRDNNPSAASSFCQTYLDRLDAGSLAPDSTMMMTVLKLEQLIINNDNADALYRSSAIYDLRDIYSGKYMPELKDSVLEQQYVDSIKIRRNVRLMKYRPDLYDRIKEKEKEMPANWIYGEPVLN